MVEQTNARECHGDAILVARIDDVVIADRAARLRNKFYTALVCALNVVAEREERVAAHGNALKRRKPSCFLLAGEHLRLLREKVQLANEVGKLLNSFFAVSENYPELKAVESFRTLQLRVSDLEDMLSDRRELYNESVNMYNIGIHEMPALLFARPMGYTDKPLLHISEEEKKYDGIRF